MPPLRRLSALRSHLSSPAAADRSELISSIAESAHELSDAPPRLLDDDQLQQFIRDGAVELELAELPASFHAAVAARAQEHHKSGRWPQGSNNIYAAMPELRHVFNGPTCRGALQSVLGERYVMHAHRHMHVTNMNSFQNFHKDGQSGHGPLRHHRPRWAMIMYGPLPNRSSSVAAVAVDINGDECCKGSDRSILQPQVLSRRRGAGDGADGNHPVFQHALDRRRELAAHCRPRWGRRCAPPDGAVAGAARVQGDLPRWPAARHIDTL